jgi:hypothetical protein
LAVSYDLFFAPAGGKRLSLLALRAWFERRPGYTVSEREAAYENDSTGVYFRFDLDVDGTPAFNLNYFRPHTFALEAAPEVSAFIGQFAVAVDDPQLEGMGTGPFSVEGFLRGWNAGNEFTFRAVKEHRRDAPVHALPWARLEALWTWNRTRDERADGADVFVPRISFGVRDGQVITWCAWPEAIPVVLPEVDRVVLLNPDRPQEQQLSALPWAQIAPILPKGGVEATPVPHAWLVHDGEPPPATRRLFEEAEPDVERPFEGLSPDVVLDAELVAKYLG